MDQLNTYLSEVGSYWRDLCVSEGVLRHYAPGDYFIEAGRTGRYFGYVKSGTLKYIAPDAEGNEHVINFEFPGGYASNFPDSIYGIPSKVSIKANSACEIYCIPTAVLRSRLATDKDLQFIVTTTSEKLFRQVYDRLIDSYTVTPKQRYEQLVSRCPDLFELFQLKDIASFLRITPVHLSRLRKEMKG